MTRLRYVYAVCRPFDAALQAQLTGVAGVPPKLLTHHGLVAVVSTVPEADFAEEPLRQRTDDGDRAHHAVIDALTAVTTPLPLRPATVFRDDSAVRVMIEEREDDFRRALDRFCGRVEWRVKVYLEGLEENAEVFAGQLHRTLSRYAEDHRLYASPNVLEAAYLVTREDSEQFVELVDRTKREADGIAPGPRVELTGPWAVYSFFGSGTGCGPRS
ncbi:GvpL/GvpF family gas vesicle protein [Streptomyces sp. GQFP]|uniref:GvpL/GvpF family gas vesicle protein n=1 Tax=Streptomyces sp. GQFP TaxID=2907545 RepID=UPI001F32AEA9|nr:GvpL/GvpF family gas vesicle protein [Streptomyces sp. GQFP]UIX29775.1 GvpL/GvpF family gas vesicle protein [Streptomyces sp. GQFP]